MSWIVKMIDGELVKIHDVIVHDFYVGDIDDPDIYAANPIIDWQKTEAGAWVMERAFETPQWLKQLDYNSYGYKYIVRAKLKEVDYLVWTLKFKS
jgi:hypothetical protein